MLGNAVANLMSCVTQKVLEDIDLVFIFLNSCSLFLFLANDLNFIYFYEVEMGQEWWIN